MLAGFCSAGIDGKAEEGAGKLGDGEDEEGDAADDMWKRKIPEGAIVAN